MFGRSRKKREAKLRQKISVNIPPLTKQDKHELQLFRYYPHDQLHYATVAGDVAIVFEIMCQGFDVNGEAELLLDAVKSTNTDVLQLLLETGTSHHKRRGTYLIAAIKDGNDKATTLLLDYGSEVDSSCILEALKQGDEQLATKLIDAVPERLQELTVRTVYLEAIRQNMGDSISWIRKNHSDSLDGILRSELTEAVLKTGRNGLESLGKQGLKRVNMDKLMELFIKEEKLDEFAYIVSITNKKHDYDRMLSYAIQHKKSQIIAQLRDKGGEITSQTIIFDMLQHKTDWSSDGEGANEAIRRRHLLENVKELNKHESRLLLYMIRNNKHHTVKNLLKMEKNWSKDVIKDGILFTATNGYISTLESLLLNSTAWDAKTYHKALELAPTKTIRNKIAKSKDKILGKEWQIDGDGIVRREQVLKPIDGSGSSNNIRLTSIFNFKSCEVTRIVKPSNDNERLTVTQKNFKDYQNDAEIHEAYKKLIKFSETPEKFYGASMSTRSKPPRRIIKRSSINRKP